MGEAAGAGEALHALVAELYPICRSITGPGVRETLARLGARIPLTVHEAPTGEPALDWIVPQEWTIRDAWIADRAGRRVVDFRRSNLHVVGYSRPVRAHLHSDPAHPSWIPYRTGYFAESWGFCLAHDDLLALPDDEYEVVIDSTLSDGSLTWGECVVPGRTPDEILLSAHVCHPSLANDNLSSIAVATAFARRLLDGPPPRHTIRVLFIPGTIGAIVWLARNEARLGAIRHGLVLANLGDPGPMHYKRSRRGAAAIDRAAALVLGAQSGARVLEWEPYGYDERQFCSPGFDLPVGCLSRTPYARFPEYHTSADNLDLVRPEALAASLATLGEIVDALERDRRCVNLQPKGEPMLGRRGLYAAIGGRSDAKTRQMAMLWVLNLSDGRHGLLDIAERSGLGFAAIAEAAETLERHGLLASAP
jgi:aminopeptidase-like protein